MRYSPAIRARARAKLKAIRERKAAARRASWSLEKVCFDLQIALIRHPSQRKAFRASRRAAKTSTGIRYLLHTALTRPGTISLFVAFTRGYAKKLAWDALKALVREFAMTDEDSISESELTIRFPNGSIVELVGANKEAEILKIKGRKYALVVIDEFQIFPAFGRALLDEVIEPAVRNANGTILVLGTPPPSVVGPFVEILNLPGWEKFHWTGAQNPFYEQEAGCTFADAKRAAMELRHVGPDDPTILREYDGELVSDPGALAVRVPAHALFDDLPPTNSSTIGVDVGWHDATALAALDWDEAVGVVHLAEEDVEVHQVESVLGTKLQAMAGRRNTFKISVDTSGNRISFESVKSSLFRQGVSLPLEPRKLMPIEAQYAMLNAALAEGRLKVRKTSRFYQDSLIVVWQDGIVGGKLAKMPHSDIIPATIFGYLAALPLLPEVVPPADLEAEAAQQREAERAARRRKTEKRYAPPEATQDDGEDYSEEEEEAWA